MLSLATMAALQQWLSWPVTPSQITVGPENCPALPTGPQAFDAALRVSDWHALFTLVFGLSAVVALAVVVWAYSTRKIGLPFVARWIRFLAVSFAVALLAALTVLFVARIPTVNCQVAETTAHLPALWVMLRALLAGAHGALFFVLWSWLLTVVLGRWLRLGRWYDNHLVPLPYFRSRPG
jgi:hypothetical protein